MKLGRLAAAGGVAGPVLFTVAWVVSSLRQASHSAAEVHPEWAGLSRPVQVLALASAAALAVFASRIAEPYNGVVQRIAVTFALTAELLIAVRMLTRPAARQPRPDRSDQA